MSHPRLLLLLVLLGTGRALSFSSAVSILGRLRAALAEIHQLQPDPTTLDKRGSGWPEEDGDLGKRTFPGDGSHQSVPPAPAKGKVHPGRTKSDRRAKVTLSLDVPTNIMNILFNIAKAKNLRAKAAANAHLMAQIGRRK